MKLEDVRKKAKKLGINCGKMKKPELIHAIQKTEGNTPCFGNSNNGNCPYTNCCFRSDCFKVPCYSAT
ncbi:MAG: Rho termination factor N-terminal domain-containing protein [Sedimentisphaerales bacterium]